MFFGYKLDAKRHAEIRAGLAASDVAARRGVAGRPDRRGAGGGGGRRIAAPSGAAAAFAGGRPAESRDLILPSGTPKASTRSGRTAHGCTCGSRRRLEGPAADHLGVRHDGDAGRRDGPALRRLPASPLRGARHRLRGGGLRDHGRAVRGRVLRSAGRPGHGPHQDADRTLPAVARARNADRDARHLHGDDAARSGEPALPDRLADRQLRRPLDAHARAGRMVCRRRHRLPGPGAPLRLDLADGRPRGRRDPAAAGAHPRQGRRRSEVELPDHRADPADHLPDRPRYLHGVHAGADHRPGPAARSSSSPTTGGPSPGRR